MLRLGSYQAATGEIVSASFILSSARGDEWTMSYTDRKAKADLNVGKDGAGSLWSASDTDLPAVSGATSVTFMSATLMHGTQNPEDVFYGVDVLLETTLPGQTAHRESRSSGTSK